MRDQHPPPTGGHAAAGLGHRRHKQTDRFVATTACQNVVIGDTKSGVKLKTLSHTADDSEATTQAGAGSLLAVGYASGTIRVFDYLTGDMTSSFDEKGRRTLIAPYRLLGQQTPASPPPDDLTLHNDRQAPARQTSTGTLRSGKREVKGCSLTMTSDLGIWNSFVSTSSSC